MYSVFIVLHLHVCCLETTISVSTCQSNVSRSMVTEVGRCHGLRPVKCLFVEDVSVITRQETHSIVNKPTVMIGLSDTTY